MEVTWDSSFLNESSNDENVTEVCVVSTTLRNNSIYIRCYLEFFLGAYKGGSLFYPDSIMSSYTNSRGHKIIRVRRGPPVGI